MKKRIGLVAALIGFMVMFYLSSPDYAHPQEGMSEFMQDVG